MDNLDFLIYKIDSAQSITNEPYITCEIVNKQIVYNGEIINHPPFEAQKWYYIYVANIKEGAKIIVKDKAGMEYEQTVSSFAFIRQYSDFIYTLHSNRKGNSVSAVFNTKIYNYGKTKNH